MSDELDKFTLQYQVDLRDSISRLEKLHEKMGSVEKKAKAGGGAIKNFASDASNELGKLVPGIDAVSGAIKIMGAEVAAAAAALSALALGVKLVMDLRSQFAQQRLDGQQIGMGGISLENATRQLVRNGGGYVNRDQAVEGLKTFSGLADAAYQARGQSTPETRKMNLMGINVGAVNGKATTTDQRLAQLRNHLRGMTEAQVGAEAKLIGVSRDWLMSVQKAGDSIGHITEMTEKEVQQRQQAEQQMDDFNQKMADVKEKFQETGQSIAVVLLPALSRLLGIINDIAKAIPRGLHDTKSAVGTATRAVTGVNPNGKGFFGKAFGGPLWSALTFGMLGDKTENSKYGPVGQLYDMFIGRPMNRGKADTEQKKADDKEQKRKDDAANKQDDQLKEQKQQYDLLNMAVNMFANAVQSFSSAINIQQAWAAWAGEIGKANGLGAPGGTSGASFSGGGKGNWASSQYAPQIAASAKKWGMDPQMVYSILMTESSGRNGQYSGTGPAGLMQVSKANWKAKGGGRDIMDPAANIDVGTQIYAEALKQAKGDVNKALGIYNGNSDPNYQAKVAGFYGSSPVRGESRNSLNRTQVQKAIAEYLHVDQQQVMVGAKGHGGVTQGDAGWAEQQLENGINNNIFNIKRQLSQAGMPQQNYAKLQTDLRNQQQGLALLRKFGKGIVAEQESGGRQRTVGEMPIININVNGAADPKAVANEVNNQITKALQDLLNDMSNSTRS